MSNKEHWEAVYETKQPNQVSWYQQTPQHSLDLITAMVPDTEAAIIDVGAGASTLVDELYAAGYHNLTALDISARALAVAHARMGHSAEHVTWLQADVLTADLPAAAFDVWHDRAAFHFLTSTTDRDRYVEIVRRSLRPGGVAIIATFAENGPATCSGLPVTRYSAQELVHTFGPWFRLRSAEPEEHITPSGGMQAFVYTVLELVA